MSESRETLRQSFVRLAEKLNAIKTDGPEAKVCLMEYGARAGRLLWQADEMRLLPEDLLPAKWAWPEGQSALDEMSPDRWFREWRAFIVTVPFKCPERFPGTWGSYLARRTKLTAVGKPLPLQQQASDYADVCRFLAEQVETPADIHITPDERKVLEWLIQLHPETVTIESLASKTRLSDKTVGKCLADLRKNDLVGQPRGPKKGFGVTPAGRALLSQE